MSTTSSALEQSSLSIARTPGTAVTSFKFQQKISESPLLTTTRESSSEPFCEDCACDCIEAYRGMRMFVSYTQSGGLDVGVVYHSRCGQLTRMSRSRVSHYPVMTRYDVTSATRVTLVVEHDAHRALLDGLSLHSTIFQPLLSHHQNPSVAFHLFPFDIARV